MNPFFLNLNRTLNRNPNLPLNRLTLRLSSQHSCSVTFCLFALLLTQFSFAQDAVSPSKLPRSRFRSGEDMLRALAPISGATRHSVVKLNVDGETVALGTVVETNGLALTKASEIKKGKLTC